MEKIMELLINADNIRMVLLAVFGYCGYVKLNSSLGKRIDGVEASLNKRIDELKFNDFAHLNNAIEALTFTLEKNKFLSVEDKNYVDSRLAH